jgi:hypothetical protein
MKSAAYFFLSAMLPVLLYCQKPFTPLGAKWGGTTHCSPTFWPCPPEYPWYHNFTVTEDTIIQGKYCTLINENDWWSDNFNNYPTIVHQDSQRIYRYDRDDETFKLVLDFSKEVGESWQIETPAFWTGADTLTITVQERSDDYRLISIEGGWSGFTLPLYEGFGGVIHNKRLLLGPEFYIIVDPIIWDELTCYIDPTEGLLFGNATGCTPNSISNKEWDNEAFVVYPNPASGHIVLRWSQPFTRPLEWSLGNVFGQIIEKQTLASASQQQSMEIGNLPGGIYFWTVRSDGVILDAGTIRVNK